MHFRHYEEHKHAIDFLVFFSCQHYDVKYYENGSIKSKASTKNGVYEGDFIAYYPSGEMKARGFWRNGLGNGYVERFFIDGSIEEKSHWKDNKLHGDVEVYYENGQLRLSAHYKNGCKVGDYIIYSNSGHVSEWHKFDNHCNLYYLATYKSGKTKELELFFPVFSVQPKGDSLEISLKSKLQFKGEGVILIGKEEASGFDEMLTPIHIVDTLVKSVSIPNCNPNVLYYKFEYHSGEGDTLPSFQMGKRIIQQQEIVQHFDYDFM